jgi:hypothetical protein
MRKDFHSLRSTSKSRPPLARVVSRKEPASGGIPGFGSSPCSNTASFKSTSSVSPLSGPESTRKEIWKGIPEISLIHTVGDSFPAEASGKSTKNQSEERLAFHFPKIANASSDEIMFLLCARDCGLKTAIYLASKCRWKCQRSLRALRAAMNEHGESYTKRSEKTTRHSVSPAPSTRIHT